jgi:CO/xanthine dehydrogenase Mo-binding subunit
MIGISPQELVFVAEFCGGGFGGKATSYPLMALPALMSKKLGGRPCMLRVSRAEEFYNGYARAGFQAWAKLGFSESGKMVAADVYCVQDLGNTSGFWDFNNVGSSTIMVFQPENMRFRAVPVLTNTTPKGAQRGPGENQASNMLEPLLDKAARELGMDRVALRIANAPGGGKGAFYGAKKGPVTSAYLREALEKGRDAFNWDERVKNSGKRVGNKVRALGVGQAYHTAGYNGFDGLVRITPDGKLHIHTGVGNLGTYSLCVNITSCCLRCWVIIGTIALSSAVEQINISHLTSDSSVQTPPFTMSRTNFAAASDAKLKLLEIAASKFGGTSEDFELDNEVVISKSDKAKKISFADCAKMAIEMGGKYSGAETPEDINPLTAASVVGIAGTGLVGVAKDNLPKEGTVPALAAAFVEIEVDLGNWEVRNSGLSKRGRLWNGNAPARTCCASAVSCSHGLWLSDFRTSCVRS